MQLQETQFENTTPTQAIAADETPDFDATPARQVVHLSYESRDGGVYVATLEDGEVLDVPDAADAAVLGHALKTGRRVHVATVEDELLAVRLEQVWPIRSVPETLTTQCELSLVVEEIARALFLAAGIQAQCALDQVTFDSAAPNVRENFRAAAVVAIRKFDIYRVVLAADEVQQRHPGVPVETLMRQLDQALLQDRGIR